jgi:hypothetical protein
MAGLHLLRRAADGKLCALLFPLLWPQGILSCPFEGLEFAQDGATGWWRRFLRRKDIGA